MLNASWQEWLLGALIVLGLAALAFTLVALS